jgi:hypothetical protein
MSLIKKIDVKNYLSARHRNGGHLRRPVTQPDTTSLSAKVTLQLPIIENKISLDDIVDEGIRPEAAAS